MHNVLLSVYGVSLFQVQPATFALLKLVQSSLRLAPTMPCIHLVYMPSAVKSLICMHILASFSQELVRAYMRGRCTWLSWLIAEQEVRQGIMQRGVEI